MAEYLSPDVYIEELPSRLKAIEGTSTSTAAFVGRARRGTVPGYVWPGSGTPNLPFTPTSGFVLTADPAPVLVTSFADFQRQFGPPWPLPTPSDPSDYGYLGWAVRAFFANGGKRVYIARIVDPLVFDQQGKVISGDTPSTLRVAQGSVYRLLRSAAKGNDAVFFTSTRGLNQSDQLTFFRHSDGSQALGAAAAPAVALGAALTAPFALQNDDELTVTPTPPGTAVSAKIVAQPATVSTSGAVPFAIPDGATLKLRVGPASGPAQMIIFSASDKFVPITANNATLDQVVAVLSFYASGLKVSKTASAVVLETEEQGTDARLEIIGGTAVTPLFGSPPSLATGSGNVPDAAHVTIKQLENLLSSPDFKVDDGGFGRVRFSTTQTGAAVSIKLDEVPAGSGLLQRLGFGAVPTVTSTGSDAISGTVTIASYDLQSNSITLVNPLPGALDVNDAYALLVGSPPNSGAGPKFIARSPGAWSAGLTIAITNADRAPTQVTGPVAKDSSNLPVQSVAGLYIGAVIEVDHNSASRSIHQITDINASTRVITIDPPLPNPPLTVVVNPATDKPAWVRALEVDMTVTDTTGAAPTEVYRGLSWNQDPNFADLRRHYAWAINARSRLVSVQPPAVGSPGVDQISGSEGNTLTTQPTTPDGFPMKSDTIGSETFNYDDQTWIGFDNGPGDRSGIQSLIDLTEARIIATPGITTSGVQAELIDQCELLRFRFAILDGELDPAGGSITSILTHRNLYDTSFAAYYQPWATVTVDGQNRYLPPSGYLAGIYARVDDATGPWKAPANEPVLNVIGLKTYFTTGEQDILNPRGVNLIRRFDIGGIRVWGARTLSSDPDVKYTNVRRALILFESSIAEGTRWVVFESNTPDTWSRVTNSVSAFLLTQWRNGALFGRRPEEAFFVRCDETTMTADDILNGRLICLIGVAIVRPAEFVVFRIEQITTFGATS
jgi:phage tail sheath protein FI